jgi:hypothetical protein
MAHADPGGLHANPPQNKECLDYFHNRRELEHTGVQGHSEILRHQSQRNNTVRKRRCEPARLKIQAGTYDALLPLAIYLE